jgi:CRP-like cAMP-binding protein
VQTGRITQEGVVQKITWRNTVILTDLMETVFIPNVTILVSAITNFDLPDTNAHRKLTLEIDYGVSVDSVERILYAGTLNAMGVKFSSPPRVVALELKESGVLYEIRYSITDIRDRVAAHHAVIKSVLESMRVANITVSRCLDFDQDVRIANRAQDVYHLVQQVRLFSGFPQEALNDLASGLVASRFGASSRIVHAGDTTPAIFIVAEGIISRPRLSRDEHMLKQRFIATEFFGEEALVSGLPHQSTVVAETNVLLYQLNKEVLQHLLLKSPSINKQLATNLATIYASENSDLIANKSDRFEYQKSLYEGLLSANFTA